MVSSFMLSLAANVISLYFLLTKTAARNCICANETLAPLVLATFGEATWKHNQIVCMQISCSCIPLALQRREMGFKIFSRRQMAVKLQFLPANLHFNIFATRVFCFYMTVMRQYHSF